MAKDYWIWRPGPKTGIKWDSATKSLTWDPEQDKIDREANTPQDQRTMKIVA